MALAKPDAAGVRAYRARHGCSTNEAIDEVMRAYNLRHLADLRRQAQSGKDVTIQLLDYLIEKERSK
jgi:hypothetical protein